MNPTKPSFDMTILSTLCKGTLTMPSAAQNFDTDPKSTVVTLPLFSPAGVPPADHTTHARQTSRAYGIEP